MKSSEIVVGEIYAVAYPSEKCHIKYLEKCKVVGREEGGYSHQKLVVVDRILRDGSVDRVSVRPQAIKQPWQGHVRNLKVYTAAEAERSLKYRRYKNVMWIMEEMLRAAGYPTFMTDLPVGIDTALNWAVDKGIDVDTPIR